MRDRRRRIAGDVSDDAYAGWRAFSSEFGVSVAALLEVFGLRAGEWIANGLTLDGLPVSTGQIVRDAKALDVARRQRAGIERRPSW